MRSEPPRNVAATVRQRLLDYSHAHSEPFQTLLTRYAMERLLYRLSRSSAADRYLLKGALLFKVWSDQPHRTTRDIDLLGFGEPSVDVQADMLRSLCGLAVAPDGIEFMAGTVLAAPIRDEGVYGGVRVRLVAGLEAARIPVQIDIGFGDAVASAPTEADFPVILDFPPPRLRMYPPEAAIAEKVHALVILGLGNSRMKDLFDLLTLGSRLEFTAERLYEAISATFERRGTPVPSDIPIGLTQAFADDESKAPQWDAFLRRQHLTGDDLSLAHAISFIAGFVWPIMCAVEQRRPIHGDWPVGGPWRERSASP